MVDDHEQANPSIPSIDQHGPPQRPRRQIEAALCFLAKACQRIRVRRSAAPGRDGAVARIDGTAAIVHRRRAQTAAGTHRDARPRAGARAPARRHRWRPSAPAAVPGSNGAAEAYRVRRTIFARASAEPRQPGGHRRLARIACRAQARPAPAPSAPGKGRAARSRFPGAARG